MSSRALSILITIILIYTASLAVMKSAMAQEVARPQVVSAGWSGSEGKEFPWFVLNRGKVLEFWSFGTFQRWKKNYEVEIQ